MNGCDILDNKQKLNIQRRSIFDIISEKIFSLLKNGMFGYFFTSYDEANEKYLSKIRRKKGTAQHGKTRRVASRLIERNLLVNAVPKFMELLLRLSLRDYGIMMFIMGALISVLYPLNDYILFLNVTLEMFISGIAICVSSVPMLFSSKSLSYNLYTSKLCNSLFFKFLGLNKEKMREASEKNRIAMPNLAFFIGIGLGVISYFVMPLRLVAIIGLIVLAYCVLRAPEIGVIAIILGLPFTPIVAMQICVAFVFVCYLFKCIVGKRTFKFEYFDIWVVLVLAVTFVRGTLSKDLISSLKEATLCVSLMLSYFVVTNLIRSKEWFRRCLMALVTSGLIVSIIAIIQAILGRISISVPDIGRLFTNGQSVISSFADSDALAQFLVAIIPFTLVHIISERGNTQKLIGFIMGATLLVTVGLTHSLSGVIGIVFATLLLLMIFNRNFAYLAIVVIAVCPILYFTLPTNALEQIMSTKMLEGLTISSVVETIRDGFQMFLSNPLGIGAGENVFNLTFNSSDGYVNNMLIQLLIEYGIVGFIAFVAFAIMLIRLTFSYCVKAKNQYRKINCCAGFCAVTGLVVSGMINYTWNDKRLYLLFWLLVAFSFAYMRIERQDEEPKGIAKDFTSATMDVTLTGDIYHDTVPKRRYVRMPKNSSITELDLEIKEFEETNDDLPRVKELEEVENQEVIEIDYE